MATTGASAATAMSPADLAELLGAFNDATSRLHSAHERLQAEVARLQDELRQANEQLERSRRLAALGEMAAGIAHEIRNPLGSIRLYARMLDDDLKDHPAEREVAQRITSAVRSADAVVHDVLAFAREFSVRPSAAGVADLFTRAIEEATGNGAAAVAVDRRDQRSAVREIECDPFLIQRAIVNIISNAVQAMAERPGGNVELRLTTDVACRKVVDPDGVERTFAVLSVTDTGPGVPDHVMERMFNPFFTTRATGTGLGLAIVHRIVDAHGGRVSVRNITDGGRVTGATVEVQVPFTNKRNEEPIGGQALAQARSRGRRRAAADRERVRVTEGAE